jgi:excisionase family DNA binding protein
MHTIGRLSWEAVTSRVGVRHAKAHHDDTRNRKWRPKPMTTRRFTEGPDDNRSGTRPTGTRRFPSPRAEVLNRHGESSTARQFAAERLLLTVSEAAQLLGIGRSLLYELLADGQVESIHVGRLRRIPTDALADYIDRQRPTGNAI